MLKLGHVMVAMVLCAAAPHALAQPEIRRSPKCSPIATLRGLPHLVDKLGIELKVLDISTENNSQCETTSIAVEQLSSGYFISLQDESGRSAYRRVSTLRVAASWIDSWMSEEFSVSLLATRPLPARFRVVPQAKNNTVSKKIGTPDSVPANRQATPWLLSIGYERSTSNTSEGWQGLRVELCRHFSSLCLGGIARLAESLSSVPDIQGINDYQQGSQDLLLSLRLPIALGRNILTPRVAAGVSRLTMNRACVIEMPADGICGFPGNEDLPDNRYTWAPRVEIGLSLSLPITSKLLLNLGGGVDVRPLGESRELDTTAPPTPCDPSDPSDPNCIDPPGPDGFVGDEIFPADPEQFWRLSIGLEVRL